MELVCCFTFALAKLYLSNWVNTRHDDVLLSPKKASRDQRRRITFQNSMVFSILIANCTCHLR